MGIVALGNAQGLGVRRAHLAVGQIHRLRDCLALEFGATHPPQ